ncbi:MAG: YegS/Rv2252/BmrU family lipid kinase [Clostridiales bacterium]|jgi:diacylglycerol kinase (ATP)|nr:YegS/Rv2252/BmrU family lipid kinase [Clostridiales bacterium]
MEKQLIVLNPLAGKRQAERRIDELRGILEADGMPSELYQTSARGDAHSVVLCRAGEFARIVCIGGDGTLNEVISGLVESKFDRPIGYIPAGTTNDLAASYGLSFDLLKAARNVVEGEAIYIDVGSFNGRHFAYTASFGAFTRAAYAAPQQVKNVLGHLAYILEGVRDVARIRPYRVRFDADGERFEEDYIFGTVSNSTSMGGVLRFDPRRVDLHDGKFEMLLVRAPEHIGQLVLAAAALQRQNYDNELLHFVSAGRIVAEADPEMAWTLDGEYQPGAGAIEILNLHDAVRLIVARR